MKSKRKNIFSVLLVIVLMLGTVGAGYALLKNNSSNTDTVERVVEITENEGKLSNNQIKSLNGGAIIKYNDEIYQLSQTGEENVYAYTDSENIFVRKYIAVNFTDGFYRAWNQLNDEYVTKALLSNALGDYTTDSDMNNALRSALVSYIKSSDLSTILADYAKDTEVQAAITNALVNYMTGTEVNDILTTALKDYMTGTEVNSALTDVLKDYMKSDSIKSLISSYLASYVGRFEVYDIINYTVGDIVTMKKLYEPLYFETNRMYIVQAFDTHENITKFSFIGGSKVNDKGQFALVLVGDDINESLTIYQTGSVVLSNLAATSAGSSGIKLNGAAYLRVFEIGLGV